MGQMDEEYSKTRGGKDDEDGITVLWAKKGFVSTLEHEAPPVGTLPPHRWRRVLENARTCPGPPVATLAAIVGSINISNPADA